MNKFQEIYWTYQYTILPLERELWEVADFSHSLFYMIIYQWFP
jgi:hypothetical protein